ncbi:hypothetical protein GGR57DRAFT_181175 [Xylariaceae sp. FL1272]|nr:hypothetical protein GGR57DRAFT_181175 [Xylariaceae sp. FL1272]
MSYLQNWRSSTANRWLQRLLRVLQFLAATVALGLFCARLARIASLTERAYNTADGAVEGILAAAVPYTLIAMFLSFLIRDGGPRLLRWLLVLLDIFYLGAFIAVAVLTRPRGPAGPHGGECDRIWVGSILSGSYRRRHNCALPWGVFIIAIISAVLHALTALFHQVHDKRKDRHRLDSAHEEKGLRGERGNGHRNGDERGSEDRYARRTSH